MIVSNCPRCNEDFCVPHGEFPEQAYAQCPWCRETFPLSDVLSGMPPMLEILSADGQPITAVPQALAAGLSGGASSTAETVAGEGISDSFEFDDGELDATVTNETVTEETVTDEPWDEDQSESEIDDDAFMIKESQDTWDSDQVAAPVASMKVSPRRPQQKKGAGIRTAIGVVAGGLLALPLAGGIMVLFDFEPDLGFWPFDGPSSSNSRSVAAPPADLSSRPRPQKLPTGRSLNPTGNADSFSGSDSKSSGDSLIAADDPADAAIAQIMTPSDAEETSGPSEDADITDAITDGPGAPNLQSAADQPSITMPDSKLTQSPTDSVAIESGEDQPAENAKTLELPSDLDPMPEVTSLDSTVDDLAASKPDSSADASRSPPAQPAELDAASAESAESIATADRAVEALVNFQGTEKKRRVQLIETYAQVAAACELAAGESNALRGLATRIANSTILEDVEYAGSQWLAYKGRSSDGVALIGQPGTNDEGKILTLGSGKVVPLRGDAPLPSAQKVLAMGRIIDDGSSVELVLAEPLP